MFYFALAWGDYIKFHYIFIVKCKFFFVKIKNTFDKTLGQKGIAMLKKVFVSSRGGDRLEDFKEVLLNPKADFGGLWTLNTIPKIPNITELVSGDYNFLAQSIFKLLGLYESYLPKALKTYESFDDTPPAPLISATSILPNLFIQKLYGGPSRAFKDMALQPFGVTFREFSKSDKKYLILAATSGDTGPATLESFANEANIFVCCLYPEKGTSDVQRLQMTTQSAKNLKVLGIKGNFDDAQNALKTLLNDTSLLEVLKEHNIALSAANSVNFGRIAFQILYHIDAYLQLVRQKEIALKDEIITIIPSGNFGNALGAFYAKQMGIPIAKIYIASNANDVLTEFINTGKYDLRKRKLLQTNSPAMDILKSSNVERVLFALYGANRTKELLEHLQNHNYYELTPKELESLREFFSASACNDSFCLQEIANFAKKGMLIDPHTACGIKAYKELKDKEKTHKVVLCSTAEWTKFAPTIAKALGYENLGDKEALEIIAKTQNYSIPQSIQKLFSISETQKEVINKEDIKQRLLEWILQ